MNILTIYEKRIGTYDKQLEEDVLIQTDRRIEPFDLKELREKLDKYLYGMNEEDERWDGVEVEAFAERFLEGKGYKIMYDNTEQMIAVMSTRY